MMQVRDIMSTVEDVQYGEDTILLNLSTLGGYYDTCGGYHEYHGVFSTVGYSKNTRFSRCS